MSKARPTSHTVAEQIRSDPSTDPRAIRTRAMLQTALISLLKTHSLAEITPRQIAAKAGLAHGTFYRHHPSKEAMIEQLARAEVAALFDSSLSELMASGGKAAALAYAKHIAKNKRLWSALLSDSAAPVVREEMLRFARKGAEERAIADDRLPSALSIAFSTSAMIEIASWWLDQNEGYPAEFMAEMIVELVHTPIRNVSTSPVLKIG